MKKTGIALARAQANARRSAKTAAANREDGRRASYAERIARECPDHADEAIAAATAALNADPSIAF
jgi:hypothetical protein